MLVKDLEMQFPYQLTTVSYETRNKVSMWLVLYESGFDSRTEAALLKRTRPL